jgi:hypothetical protein
MGRDERAKMDATLFVRKRERRTTMARMAAADAMILDAFAVTLIVSAIEEGAAVPTASTSSFTAWGPSLQALPDEAARQLAQKHFEGARAALERNAATLRTQIENAQADQAASAAEKPKEEASEPRES